MNLTDLTLDQVRQALCNSGFPGQIVHDAFFANEWSRGAFVYNLRFKTLFHGLTKPEEQLLSFHNQCYIKEYKGQLYADI